MSITSARIFYRMVTITHIERDQSVTGCSVKYIKARQIIDGTGNAPIIDGAVIVRGKTIEAVGTAAELPRPEGAVVIDLGYDTLLPGLIDTHGHLVFRYGARGAGGVTGLFEQSAMPGGVQMMWLVRNARAALLCGVTTMRMVAEGTPDNPIDSYAKAGIAAGVVPGPRIIDGGTGVTPTGGHGGRAIWTDGVDALRARVRKDFHSGATWMKILLIDSGPETTIYSDEELEAIVDEAHRWGMKVTVHCTGRWGSSIIAAARAGVDNVEHARPLTPEVIAALKTHDVGVSLTPLVYVGFRPDASTWDFLDNGATGPADWIDYGRKQYFEFRAAHPEVETVDRPYLDGEPNRAGRDFFPSNATQQSQALAALRAGLKVSVGLDTVYYGAVGNAVEYLIEGGFTPMEGILCATGMAAQVIGEDHRIGSIVPGKLADFMSLGADPLTERWAWDTVHFVMKEGVRYDQLSWK
jgi:imidazolonepropionase-like amidohydrolase